MYGRMPSFAEKQADLEFFVGAFLTQVCFGKFDLGLKFDGPPISIVIQSSFGIKLSGGELIKHEIEDVQALKIFLNLDVRSARWASFGTLILTFESGNQLFVFDDSDQYESYIINRGAQTIVV